MGSEWHGFWFRFWFESFSWTSGFTGKFRHFSLSRYSRFPSFNCTRSPISLTFWPIKGYSGHVNARTIPFLWRISTRTSEYNCCKKITTDIKCNWNLVFSTQQNMFSCARKIILNYTFFLIAMIYCRRLGSHLGAKIPLKI